MNEEMMNTGAEGTEETQAAGVEEQAGAQGKQGAENLEQPEPEKKYTDADVDRIIAKKIAAERKRMQKLFEGEQQESELEIRERNVLRRELMADAKDALVDMGLPSSLAKIMDYSNKENFDKSFKEVTGIFGEAVVQGVKNKLRGSAPKVGTGSIEDAALRDAFAPKAR